MVWVEKDLSNFFTDGASSRFPGDRTGDPFLGQVTFKTSDLSGFSTPFHSFEGNKKRQRSFLSCESNKYLKYKI